MSGIWVSSAEVLQFRHSFEYWGLELVGLVCQAFVFRVLEVFKLRRSLMSSLATKRHCSNLLRSSLIVSGLKVLGFKFYGFRVSGIGD